MHFEFRIWVIENIEPFDRLRALSEAEAAPTQSSRRETNETINVTMHDEVKRWR